AIPPYGVERLPSQFHVRLLRPLIARLLRRTRSQGQPTPLDSGLSYPYAGLVEAFAGSPIARALARALGEMWPSPVLPRRCKLLLFAVIARGLGCGACASEAARALLKDGFSEDALTKVLTSGRARARSDRATARAVRARDDLVRAGAVATPSPRCARPAEPHAVSRADTRSVAR